MVNLEDTKQEYYINEKMEENNGFGWGSFCHLMDNSIRETP